MIKVIDCYVSVSVQSCNKLLLYNYCFHIHVVHMTDPIIVEAGSEGLNLANKRMIRARDQQILDLKSEFITVVLL